MRPLRRVAVLGAGTMGSRIAAHFANAGYPVELLDVSDAAAAQGLQNTVRGRPGAFFTDAAAALIRTGGFDNHLARIAACDWVVEAVLEDLAVKRALASRVAAVRTLGTIFSTNTSGIPLASISEGWSAELRAHFLGTHFFNPPRFLHLVELVPGADTAPEILAWVADFCGRRLGKGVVPCKDTPNFIANRIGCFFGSTIHQLTVEGDYTVEEVDALTGPLIGLPKSASFRLVDIIGLDIWVHVLRNLHALAPNDPARARYVTPEFMAQMMERGWLGEKSGQGFYKRVGKSKEIWAIDRKTLEYHPAQKAVFASAEAARPIEDLGARLRALVTATDRAGSFLWPLLRDLLLYSAQMLPEIADRVVEIDRAMRWGFAFQLGPFEMWDILGVAAVAERAAREGHVIPAAVERMIVSSNQSFYQTADHAGQPVTRYYDLPSAAYRDLEPRPGTLTLADLKRARGVVHKNAGASLIDLNDGVLCLEFHSKANAVGEDAVQMVQAGLEETARNFAALVIANQGKHFSAGANLMMVLLSAQEGEWEELDAAIRQFQQTSLAIQQSPKPVVAAPFGMTLGGACELALHAARLQAGAETYIGLVETGVGLIPAGGGCKEMLARGTDLKTLFELIGYAKVSSSAAHARELGLLRPADAISMNPERLVADAKAAALALCPHYAPAVPRTDIAVEGEPGYALLKMSLFLGREGGFISDYDFTIGEKLAHILSGGRGRARKVAEQELLDLEREAFLSLCGHAKTQERIAHMLKTGKPLRN